VNGGRRHLLLVNPSAGGGRTIDALPDVEVALRGRGLSYRVVLTESGEHGCAEARAAAEAGEDVVVLSGDGLVGQVGGALAGTGAALGVIPGGRGNDFARVVGIPTAVPGAVEILAAGATRAIDVGEINGRRFLCIASCGLDSDCNRIANETRFVRGNLVYLYSVLRAIAAWKPARFTVVADGDRRQFEGYSVAAANSKAFGGGMYLAPDAELDDGLLDIVYVTQVGKLRYLANLPKVFKGRHTENEEVTVLRATEVQITADRPFAVYADGDHIADLPATVRLLPRALNVIAPASAGS
jgi:YegS/Rv2252/BmrU family lipid kinase